MQHTFIRVDTKDGKFAIINVAHIAAIEPHGPDESRIRLASSRGHDGDVGMHSYYAKLPADEFFKKLKEASAHT